eukprot:TRINITY_DN122368_c0_g1_i1.p1 TRINITY_DN122368_c0_g1~~TRINITY_DN122368_c0_g1_i1.p1  ORF type:complete len:237 (-),score=64.97 TRINITY_DN122368_c0_g1_i1:162-872(-)
MWLFKRPAPADGSQGGSSSSSQGPAAKKRRLTPCVEEFKELHDVQLELQLLEERCAEEQIAIQARYDRYRQPHFDRRGKLLRDIPQFWRKAIVGHPQGLAHPAELEVLQLLTDLAVRDNLDKRGSYEVRAKFSSREYFQELEIVKRVHFQDAQTEAVEPAKLTPSGESGKQLLAELAASTGQARRSVLGWFISSEKSGQSAVETFGEVLRRDLWQDPVVYYMNAAAATEGGAAAAS